MCGVYIAMLQNPRLGYMWFVHCHVTKCRARVCVVCLLSCYRMQGYGMCGLYIAMLQNPRLGYMWFVHCHVTESRTRVCVVYTLPCYSIQD